MTRGRPPLPRGEGATEQFPIRLTEAERAELTAGAAVAGQSLARFLIDAGLERARR